MAIRRTLAQFSDEIVAADLADDSVTTAKIADSQITAAKVAADVATQAELNVVSAAVDAVDTSAGIKPHIRPGVLYPAVAGKGIDGSTTVTSWGTDFAISGYPTLKYYYTDIKGSKPIKDPRIGAHFGSQRHSVRSIQLQEQETAMNGGFNVYRVDGREWFRAVGDNVAVYNNSNGYNVGLYSNDNFWEITFYGIDLNWAMSHHSTNRGFVISVDGGSESAEKTSAETTMAGDYNPKFGRYLDSHSLYNVGVGATLGIHTVKIRPHSTGTNEIACSLIEIITQDTTSATTRNQIQIPAQNVVSYGKKFAVSAAAHHHNPFATKGDGSASTIPNNTTGDSVATGWAGSTSAYWESTLDTTTSLGLSAWESGGNFYRPVNGGRIVKWIDSTGTIKTSVNMMPPACQTSGSATGGHSVPTGVHNWSTLSTPVSHTTTFDHSQAEVAKTFHWREFGNGNANNGVVTGSTGGAYRDLSMLNGTSGTECAYIMDDGITSVAGKVVHTDSFAAGGTLKGAGNGNGSTITFIGTGVTIKSPQTGNFQIAHLANNLPYGTQVLKYYRSSTTDPSVEISGFSCGGHDLNNNGEWSEVTFYQPKLPPIPEDACIISDYMLMADHVIVGSAGLEKISKGVRRVHASRDILYDHNASLADRISLWDDAIGGFRFSWGSSNAASRAELPAFCTNQVHYGYAIASRYMTYSIDTGSGFSTITPTAKTGTGSASFYNNTGNAHALGLVKHKVYGTAAASSGYVEAIDIVSPTHTSSHYQAFESPFLFELAGGDRNMEQTNLVVTADGKTWDEVTRDTSYIGVQIHNPNTDTAYTSGSSVAIFDEHRGNDRYGSTAIYHYMSKNFAVGYDRQICLVDGTYKILAQTIDSGQTTAGTIQVNGTVVVETHSTSVSHSHVSGSWTGHLKRGDWIRIIGRRYQNRDYSKFEIVKLD